MEKRSSKTQLYPGVHVIGLLAASYEEDHGSGWRLCVKWPLSVGDLHRHWNI